MFHGDFWIYIVSSRSLISCHQQTCWCETGCLQLTVRNVFYAPEIWERSVCN